MLDRVRQAVADVLTAHFSAALVWDLFAGTGANGIEALSRGAAEVLFVERAAAALRVLRGNLEQLPPAAQQRCQVLRADAWRPPLLAACAQGAALAPDLVFCDPPYGQVRDDPAALAVRLAPLASALARGGVLVLHLPAEAMPTADLEALAPIELRTWGSSTVAFVRR
jgi:16S rRNA (guanine966-N2)-methyltransferase